MVLWIHWPKAHQLTLYHQKSTKNWLQTFTASETHPNPGTRLKTVLCRAIGRYDLCNICNLDETPLPFAYLTGQT